MARKYANLPFENLEQVDKEVSKIFESMKTLRDSLSEVLAEMQRSADKPKMVEEVSRYQRAVEISIRSYQKSFPHLIPFDSSAEME